MTFSVGLRRKIRPYVIASIFFHITLIFFVISIKRAPEDEPRVDFVELVDIPRATELAKPFPGVIRSRPRTKSPEKKPEPPPKKPKLDEEKRILEGKVPDLPVNPDLSPEKSFPEIPPRAAQKEKGEKKRSSARSKAGTKLTVEGGGGKDKVPRIKDMTPSLGKMVLAAREKKNQGPGKGTGENIGTRGKPEREGDYSEMTEGGTVLTPLDNPSIQYISYFASIKRKIELVWHYPFDAVQMGIQGDVIVDFSIGSDGTLKGLVVNRSSGHSLLDREAVNAIKKASPFSPIPSQYDIDELNIRANFIYEMHYLNIR